MRLSLESAASSLKRITSAFPGSDHERAEYTKAIWEQFGWMDPLRFDMVCVEVYGQMREGRRPVPSAFRGIYQRLDESHGWSLKDNATKVKCARCGATGFVYETLTEERSGLQDRFVRPCPSCRSNHPMRDLPVRDGWQPSAEAEPAMNHRAHMEQQVRELKPPGARFVLGMVEKGAVKYPEDLLLKIAEIAGQDYAAAPAPQASVFEKAVEEIVPPNVAHMSEEHRRALQAQAEAEGVPF